MRLTTTDRIDDLYSVTFAEFEVVVFAPWHDFTVDFNSDALTAEAQGVDYIRETGFVVDSAVFAVDGNVHDVEFYTIWPLLRRPMSGLGGPGDIGKSQKNRLFLLYLNITRKKSSVQLSTCRISDVSETMALLRLLMCLAVLLTGGQTRADVAAPRASVVATRPDAPTIVTAQATPVSQPRPSPTPKCKLNPPKGYPEIGSIEYACHDIEEMINAQAVIDAKVTRIFEQRRQAKAAKHKRKQAQRSREKSEQQRKQAEAARLVEQKLKQEQEALAASKAVRAELSSEITKKMITLCEKTWAEGKHRCYCEKYIEFAPAHIQAKPDCK